ncbi:MAG TPA: hypothetical protein VIQ03_13665, partial [Gammaproteobacteria bacterium]
MPIPVNVIMMHGQNVAMKALIKLKSVKWKARLIRAFFCLDKTGKMQSGCMSYQAGSKMICMKS